MGEEKNKKTTHSQSTHPLDLQSFTMFVNVFITLHSAASNPRKII